MWAMAEILEYLCGFWTEIDENFQNLNHGPQSHHESDE